MNTRTKLLLVSLFCFLINQTAIANGLASFSISPTKVVLTERDRSASITLKNLSDESISYRIRFIEMGIASNGDIVELEPENYPEGYLSAAQHIRVSPKQVRLSPGESQVVRVLIKKRSNLKVGEYRSHLEFRVLPDVSRENIAERINKMAPLTTRSGLETQLGSTMPVIIKVGSVSAHIDINEVSLVGSDEFIDGVRFTINRSGKGSVFGNISVNYKYKGETKELARVRGYGLYYPYLKEKILVKMSPVSKSFFNEDGGVIIRLSNSSKADKVDYWFDSEVDFSISSE